MKKEHKIYDNKKEQRKTIYPGIICANRRIFAVLITCMLMLGFLPAVTSAAYTPGVPVSFTATTTVTLEQSGWYYVEAWGGNGGSSSSIAGGVSQLESGYFHFSAGDTIYIQVGTAGGNGRSNSYATGGSAGSGGTGDYFGSGYDGGRGGNGLGIASGGNGGGGGGAASGILLNGTDASDIVIASGGGGGAGGSASIAQSGGTGGNSDLAGGNGGGESSSPGNAWSTDSTNGYDGGWVRHNGENASLGSLYGGGGAGGGGGGYDGDNGGGGRSGCGGKTSAVAAEGGGGGAGGQSSGGQSTPPSGITAPNANSRTTNADGQVYLTFLAETYTVSYTAPDATNGAPPTDSNKYIANDTVIVLGENTLQRDGYVFAGWSDGTTVHETGDDFAIKGNTTLTAVWEPNYEDPYWLQITYSAPDATSGAPPADPNNYTANGTATILGAGTLKRSGYSFVGWSDGTKTYKTGDLFKMTEDTTLTAVWKKNEEQKTNSTPKTGDYNNTWVWALAAFASAVCVTGLFVLNRRRRQKNEAV